MSWFSDLLKPIVSPLVDLTGSILGYNANKETNQQTQQLAEDQKAWEERMSNTAFQRARGDLEKAGLNPMLAIGKMASTPSVSVPQLHSPGEIVSKAGSSAMSTFLNNQNIKEQIATQRSMQQVNNATAQKIRQEALNKEAENIKEGNTGLIQSKGAGKGVRSIWYRGLRETRRVIDAVNPLKGLFGSGGLN